MKKILLSVILVLSFVSTTWACVGDKCDFDNEVKSSGEGNKGYIFTYDCTKNNNIDVGKWVDVKDVPELKGDPGISGKDGVTPVKGVDYFDGTDGKTPVKNVDYFDGVNGADGKDADPATVNNLQNSINSNSSSINNLNNRLDNLEETQSIVGAEVRILDTKKWTVTLFADYSENRQMIDRTGIKFTYKIGSSYEEREIKKLQQRIEALEVR
jgi:hypothetical protein